MALAFSISAIFWDLSTARKIRMVRQRSMQPWSATRIPSFAGGSYVIVQKYLHDLHAWNALPTEAQERIIGRTKLTNVELDETVKPSFAHNELTKIVENGEEIKIVRDNMPFGEVGKGDFGTYFIGYARSPRTIEQMLENMFIGNPPGNYDRILDFSRAVTGNLFFVPTADFLENVTIGEPAVSVAAAVAERRHARASGWIARHRLPQKEAILNE